MSLYRRKNNNPSLIRSNFLYTINTFYTDFTLICADGFKSLLGTSSALFIPKTDTKKSIFLHKNSSVFSVELYGVLSALRWISLNRHCKNVIITDSYSVF